MTRQKTRTLFLVAAVVAIAALRASADEPSIQCEPVPIQRVTIDDPFWSPKLAVWRRVTITDCLDKFDRDGVMANFHHVAHAK